eukprot:TRINITY_DN4557_c0_g2_i3.p1 TRINITY_DN4557_c0_g2~~TRINITY_DN4557_c0_g2_i3.p1  ORF type:complete len:411 (+),score=70.50 TRINITY_DN4557_c0_g2_i3:124-1356(+)
MDYLEFESISSSSDDEISFIFSDISFDNHPYIPFDSFMTHHDSQRETSPTLTTNNNNNNNNNSSRFSDSSRTNPRGSRRGRPLSPSSRSPSPSRRSNNNTNRNNNNNGSRTDYRLFHDSSRTTTIIHEEVEEEEEEELASGGIETDKILNPHLLMNDFICGICFCVVWDPLQCSSCDALFCNTCLKPWLRSSNKCPNRCRARFKPMNRVVRNMLSRVLVLCRNNESGCKDEIPYENYLKHLGECAYRSVKCPNEGCQEKALVTKLQEHEQGCQFRLVTCLDCDEYIKISDESHDCIVDYIMKRCDLTHRQEQKIKKLLERERFEKKDAERELEKLRNANKNLEIIIKNLRSERGLLRKGISKTPSHSRKGRAQMLRIKRHKMGIPVSMQPVKVEKMMDKEEDACQCPFLF